MAPLSIRLAKSFLQFATSVFLHPSNVSCFLYLFAQIQDRPLNGLYSQNYDRLEGVEVLRNGNGEILTGADVVRMLLATHALDRVSAGQVLRILEPLSDGAISRTLNKLGGK